MGQAVEMTPLHHFQQLLIIGAEHILQIQRRMGIVEHHHIAVFPGLVQRAQHKVEPVLTDHLYRPVGVSQGLTHLHTVGDNELLGENILCLMGSKAGIHQTLAVFLLLKLLHIAGIGDADARDPLVHRRRAESGHQIPALRGIIRMNMAVKQIDIHSE